jgi:rhodanese-related sulfurtransferase
MKYVSVHELDEMISKKKDMQLIDVRESYEFEDENIGGENIPLNDILSQTERIARDKPVVFCCKTGKRSAAMAHTLERKFELSNLFTLEGGLENYFNTKK